MYISPMYLKTLQIDHIIWAYEMYYNNVIFY